MLQGNSSGEMVEEEGLVLRAKVKRLAGFVRSSNYVVVYTGSGISTAIGVLNFHQPSRVRAMRRKDKTIDELDFTQLKSTLTHDILKTLLKKGHIHHIVTQNIDNLCTWSGAPSKDPTELHGNYCLETCKVCDARYIRSHAILEGLSNSLSIHDKDHKTGRLCEEDGCLGELASSPILVGETLSPKEVKSAWEHTNKADLALVLGSTLSIAPACTMPLQVEKNGHLIIVNLQRTHFDGKASLVIYAQCDEVMQLLAEELHVEIDEPSPLRQENPFVLLEEAPTTSNVTNFV